MADKLPIDSNAGSQSQVGVGRAEQPNRPLHQINPNWVEDGYGIVGPQRQITRQSATPASMEFGVNNNSSPNQGPNAPCAPDPPPDMGTWVWGTIDGVCQWIDTTTCA